MERYTVVIADSSEEFCIGLQQELSSFCAVFTCGSGREAVCLADRYQPDVLVVDLMLPQLDGLSLLEVLRSAGCCPGVAATTSYVSPLILEAAEKAGVSFLLEKPCSIKAAAEAVRSLLSQGEATEGELYRRVSGILLQLGFSPKFRGYVYLRQAVILQAEHPGCSVTCELYPGLAAQYGVSVEEIKRSIRGAAMDAWRHRGKGTWELYFPGTCGGRLKRPANAEIIRGLARQLEKKEEVPLAEIL